VFTRDSSGELSFFPSIFFLLIFSHERVLTVAPLVYELNTTDCDQHISWPIFAYTFSPCMQIYLNCVFISPPLDIHANVICTWVFFSAALCC